MFNYKEKLMNKPPTDINRLRPLEKRVAQSEISSMAELRKWLKKQHFNLLWITGDTKECDEQYYRQTGKGRYHWRIYECIDRIIIESHVDRHDPGRGLTKPRSTIKMIDDALKHINKDVLEEPRHKARKDWT